MSAVVLAVLGTAFAAALLGPPVVGGNRVRTLVNGDRIFGAMLEAIGRAERIVAPAVSRPPALP